MSDLFTDIKEADERAKKKAERRERSRQEWAKTLVAMSKLDKEGKLK